MDDLRAKCEHPDLKVKKAPFLFIGTQKRNNVCASSTLEIVGG